jgi:hypothetical protein
MPDEQPDSLLTPAQELALEALLVSGSIKSAAKKSGCSDRSLRSWLKTPAFMEEYRSRRRFVVEAGLGRLQLAVARAAKTLVRNLRAAKSSDQIRAALGVIGQANAAIDLWDLAARVAAIEAAQEERLK